MLKLADVSSVFPATGRPISAACRVGFGCNWVRLWLLYCYKKHNDIAPKLYHNFGGRVKRFCRRWSTLNRRRSGSFHSGIKSITVPDSINYNGLGSGTIKILELSTPPGVLRQCKNEVLKLTNLPCASAKVGKLFLSGLAPQL